MLTRGGEHAEIDIPKAIDRARKSFPNIRFIYCWPFDHRDVAHFLAGQIHLFIDSSEGKKNAAVKKRETSSASKA
jgi:sirohydrochlorin cobaltochelatase